jgi:hypothetical protein
LLLKPLTTPQHKTLTFLIQTLRYNWQTKAPFENAGLLALDDKQIVVPVKVSFSLN